MRQLEHRRRVLWGDTDAAGIVFYPNYFRWFDQATHDLLRHLGADTASSVAVGLGAIVLEAQARFLAPIHFDDELEITSRIAEVRERAFRVEHRISHEGRAVCEGYEVRIWARLESGTPRPEPIPEELRVLLTRE